MNIFKEVTKRNLLFMSNKGNINLYDLWNLKKEELNEIAKKLNKKIKNQKDEEDFLEDENNKENKYLQDLNIKFKVVYEILQEKKEKERKIKEEREVKEEKEKLLKLLEEKEIEEMDAKSIRKKIKDLES